MPDHVLAGYLNASYRVCTRRISSALHDAVNEKRAEDNTAEQTDPDHGVRHSIEPCDQFAQAFAAHKDEADCRDNSDPAEYLEDQGKPGFRGSYKQSRTQDESAFELRRMREQPEPADFYRLLELGVLDELSAALNEVRWH